MSSGYQLPAKGSGYLNVSDARIANWENKWPALDIHAEIQRIITWLEDNPAKRWKTLRGAEDWMTRQAADLAKNALPESNSVPPDKSQHPAMRAERNWQEFEPSREIPREFRNAYIVFAHKITKGESAKHLRPALDDSADVWYMPVVALARVPEDPTDVAETRECFKEFRAVLEEEWSIQQAAASA